MHSTSVQQLISHNNKTGTDAGPTRVLVVFGVGLCLPVAGLVNGRVYQQVHL